MALLEEGVPLSDSVLWEIQKEFYHQKGMAAWGEKIVPNYITTNPYICRCYAKIVISFVSDLLFHSQSNSNQTQLNLDEPFYIIEYGAGSGRMAFFFIKSLLELVQEAGPFLSRIKFKYIMADVTMNNLTYWLKQDKLAAYFDSGILDCAIFEAQHPYDDLVLQRSGVRLTQNSIKNPLVLIGNYFFCVVPADAYMVDKNGVLSESLLTTVSTNEVESNMTDYTIITRVKRSFKSLAVPDPRLRYPYPDPPEMGLLLKEYGEILADKQTGTSFLLPTGCVRLFDGVFGRLCDGGHGRGLVLCGDKGYNFIDELVGHVGYPMSVEGSFSLMCNMDGIGRYFKLKGGSCVFNSSRVDGQGDTCLALACYLSEGDLMTSYPLTRMTCSDILEKFSSVDYYQLIHSISTHEPGCAPSNAPVQHTVDVDPGNRYLDPSVTNLEQVTSTETTTISSENVKKMMSMPENDKDEAKAVVANVKVAPDCESATFDIHESLRKQSPVRDASTCGYNIQQLLAVWRLSCWDPYVFWTIRARLLVLSPILTGEEKKCVANGIRKTLENFFFIGEDDDLPFEMARVAYQLQLEDQLLSLLLYHLSTKYFGAHYITYYNIALCHNERNQSQLAIEFLDKCQEIQPDYAPAKDIRELVMKKLSSLSSSSSPSDSDNTNNNETKA